MRVVHKFRLEAPDAPSIVKMDPLAKLLRVGVQERTIQLWAEVDPNAQKVERVFHIYASGMPINENDSWITSFNHIDWAGYETVWHVYEAK